MPTYRPLPRFLRDYKDLPREQAAAWETALALFIECLRRGRFEPGLRVKRVKGYPDVWEMTSAPNGRATFEYGDELRPRRPAHHLAAHRYTRHLPQAVGTRAWRTPTAQPTPPSPANP